MKAGVIGLGQIGGAVAECLARANMLAVVYDIREDAVNNFEGLPPVAASPAEVARLCDVIIIGVVDAAQTIAVLCGPEGALATARPGQSIILLSTVALNDLAKIRALTDEKGVTLIDSGVVGSQRARQNGLICLVGADEDKLQQVMPVFDGFARYVARMGPPGAGMTAKIIYNGILLACQRAGFDGAAMAREAGVDVPKLEQIFKDSVASVGGPLLLASRAGDPDSDPKEAHWRSRMVTMMIKDMEAALALGEAHDVALPTIKLARESLPDLYRDLRAK